MPLCILSVFSVLIGFLSKEAFIGFGTKFWGTSLFILPQNYLLSDIEFISLFAKLFPLILTLAGFSLAYFLYAFELNRFLKIKKNSIFKYIYTFLNKKWYFDRFYNQYISQTILNLSYTLTYKDIDRGLLEKVGPTGIIQFLFFFTNYLKFLQSGLMYHYLFFIFFSIFIIVIITFLTNSIFLVLEILFFLLFLIFIIK